MDHIMDHIIWYVIIQCRNQEGLPVNKARDNKWFNNPRQQSLSYAPLKERSYIDLYHSLDAHHTRPTPSTITISPVTPSAHINVRRQRKGPPTFLLTVMWCKPRSRYIRVYAKAFTLQVLGLVCYDLKLSTKAYGYIHYLSWFIFTCCNVSLEWIATIHTSKLKLIGRSSTTCLGCILIIIVADLSVQH